MPRDARLEHGCFVEPTVFQASPEMHIWREEVFGPLGVSMRTFVDPTNASRVGLIAEIPDFDAFQEFMATPAAAEAMSADGVRPETLVILAER